MNKIIKLRWGILAVWIIAAIALTYFMPNLNYIINERGNATIDKSYPSQTAKELINSMSERKGNSGLLVFYSKEKLSSNAMDSIEATLKNLKAAQNELGITGVIDAFDMPAAKAQLFSKDETTMLAQFTYENNGRDIQAILDEIEAKLENCEVSHYVTGGAFISNDFLKQTNKGVEKSAVLTVVFILAVLIVMFRSVVTPIVSLLTVGIAYLTSIGVVGQLIEKLGFPVTSLTQMFLVLILFGLGTDYNILLYTRFKEELLKNNSIDEAILATFRTAGKTVVYSSTTVFIAFLALRFVKFGVYRSGVAVAIGIVVLILLLTTLTPAIFKLFGKNLFWPYKEGVGHKQSKIWEVASSFSTKRPYIAVIAITLLVIPVLLVGAYKLSFDNLKDMSGDAPSVRGFNIVSEHFSKGTTMPTTVVIKNNKPMDNSESLAVVDSITREFKKMDRVSAVQSPTQPLGEEIRDYYTGNQISKVVDGLKSADNGIKKVGDGLSTIEGKLSVPDTSKVTQLVDGTAGIQKGMKSLTSAMEQVQKGIESGASGSEQLAAGIEKISVSITTIEASLKTLADNYTALEGGYQTFGSNYKAIEQNLQGLSQLAAGLSSTLKQADSSDSAIKAAQVQADKLSSGLTQLEEGFKALNIKYDETTKSFAALNGGLSQLSKGLGQITSGLGKLAAGQKALAEGLKKGSQGQTQIAVNMQKITAGLGEITVGQKKMTEGLSTLGSSFGQLKNGLGASSDALGKISGGINKTNDFLGELSANKAVNIPSEAFKNASFQQALDAYMSKDRTIVKINVILKDDPYSDEAIKTVKEINKQLPELLRGTVLSDAKYATGGESSATNDLQSVATSDMQLAQIMVLLGTFIVLVLIIKSFWIPIYIIGSLLLSFYSAISITSLFAKYFLDSNEIAWNVPFFGFVMIVALGVDYSIFLMSRYREYKDLEPRESIIKASANVGGVILSAALILGGTFATLSPSGINTLVELAICVCVGVIILSVVLLPFVIPALISIEERLVHKYSRYIK